LHEEAKNANILIPATHTTPVKCNIQLRNRPYQVIIDSNASVSMIAYKIVKELGLKIEQVSSSLIMSATGNSTRPLGVIRDLPITIDQTTIPIIVEVVYIILYFILLSNDWFKKVEASYN